MSPAAERDVEIELHDQQEPGWAVFAGCDGEMPYLVAFFANSGKALALKLAESHGYMFFPAVLTDQGLFSANDYRQAESVAELSSRFGLNPVLWGHDVAPEHAPADEVPARPEGGSS